MADEPIRLPPPDALGLDYATHVGVYPELQSHPRFVVLLIGLTALSAIGSILLGLLRLVDAWHLGVMLIGAGALLCWAGLGKLSAGHLRMRGALVILFFALALEILILLISNNLLRLYQLSHVEDPNNLSVSLYEIIRNMSLIPTVLGVTTWVYAAVRLAARRGNDFN